MTVKYSEDVSLKNFGTLTTDTSTNEVRGVGHLTLSAHLDSGTGTLTWEFNGPDGVWRSIYGGSDGTTVQAFTAAHMTNVYFADDVLVRSTGSASSSPVWDWQIIGTHLNRN